MMRFLFLLVLLLFSNATFSQQHMQKGNKFIFGPSIGYHYQSGNFLKTSGWLLFAPGDSRTQYIKIDAGANWTWMMDKTTVIPELGMTYYPSNVIVWPFAKAEVTPYTLSPKVGISVLSLLEIGAGYGFQLQEKKDFKPITGFNFSVGLNIPLNFHIY